MNSPLAGLSKYDFVGLLLLRTGVGALLAFHGFPILMGGEEVWQEIGSAAAIAQLPEAGYTAAGIVSGAIQLLGGLLLVLGLFTRAAALCLVVVVGFALAHLIQLGSYELSFFAHLQLALVLLGLVFTGAGRLSLDRKGI